MIKVNDKCHCAIFKSCFGIWVVKDIKAERRNKNKQGTNCFSLAVHDDYARKKHL